MNFYPLRIRATLLCASFNFLADIDEFALLLPSLGITMGGIEQYHTSNSVMSLRSFGSNLAMRNLQPLRTNHMVSGSTPGCMLLST